MVDEIYQLDERHLRITLVALTKLGELILEVVRDGARWFGLLHQRLKAKKNKQTERILYRTALNGITGQTVIKCVPACRELAASAAISSRLVCSSTAENARDIHMPFVPYNWQRQDVFVPPEILLNLFLVSPKRCFAISVTFTVSAFCFRNEPESK